MFEYARSKEQLVNTTTKQISRELFEFDLGGKLRVQNNNSWFVTKIEFKTDH